MSHKCKEEAKKAYNKAYYEANKEKLKARNAAWYHANKEKAAAYRSSYYQANKEAIQAYEKANKEKRKVWRATYYEANKEKRKVWNATYYEANKEKVKALRVAYYQANKEKRRAYDKDYYAANKDKSAAKVARRKALKIKQIPTQVRDCPIEKKRLYQTYKLCSLFTKATGIPHHVDHMWPLSDGGPHWSGNLQIITAEENLSKHAIVDPNIKATIQEMLKDIKDAY